jgi:hypothetical protein
MMKVSVDRKIKLKKNLIFYIQIFDLSKEILYKLIFSKQKTFS